ncbi:MAG: type II secretion system F family protein [Chloroflexi bacterium]|nr:type II secretion system F family protein [Chloroflexota bacterium]
MSSAVILMIVFGTGIVAVAAVLVFIGLRNPQSYDERELQARLDEFNRRGEVVDLEKIEMSMPLTERVIYPLARKLGEIATRFTPQNAMIAIGRKLELAGNPGKLDPTMFLAMQFIMALLFGGLVLAVIGLFYSEVGFGQRLLFTGLGILLGFYFPQLWLTDKIRKRQNEIRKSMPDALDLLTICVEAGLGFDAAMAKVSEKWESELSMAFARVIREIQLGKVRRDALRDMADRLGIPEMTSFVAAVIQSEQLGVSMAKVLHIQADQMRMKRRQRAEEEAHKAPVKMLIPMAFIIFPSLMIVLMTPAAIQIVRTFAPDFFK